MRSMISRVLAATFLATLALTARPALAEDALESLARSIHSPVPPAAQKPVPPVPQKSAPPAPQKPIVDKDGFHRFPLYSGGEFPHKHKRRHLVGMVRINPRTTEWRYRGLDGGQNQGKMGLGDMQTTVFHTGNPENPSHVVADISHALVPRLLDGHQVEIGYRPSPWDSFGVGFLGRHAK